MLRNAKMKDSYNFHQHLYCNIIYMEKSRAYVHCFFSTIRDYTDILSFRPSEACITYDKEKSRILDWGRRLEPSQDVIHVDNFMDELYRIFKKGKDNRDQHDLFLLRAISDFIRLSLNDSNMGRKIPKENPSGFHYVFVIPSEWEYEMREEMIRPLFIQSKVITEEDHSDRLLFLTDLESIFCLLGHPKYMFRQDIKEVLKHGEQSIMCRATTHRQDTLSIKLDLVEAQYSHLKIANPTLFPRIKSSTATTITLDSVKSSIGIFLKSEVFFNQVNTNQEKIIGIMVDYILNYFLDNKPNSSKRGFEQKIFEPTYVKQWELNQTQIKSIESISISDICAEISGDFLDSIRILLQNMSGKYRKLILAHDRYSSDSNWPSPLFPWLLAILKLNGQYFSYKFISSTAKNNDIIPFQISDIMSGAISKIMEVVQDSDIHVKPFVMTRSFSKIRQDSSSSIFLHLGPDTIINIDLSVKSVSISCSFLDNEGKAQTILDCKSVVGDTCVPPLELFFDFQDTPILKVTPQTIYFMDKRASKDLEYFSKYDRQLKQNNNKSKSYSFKHTFREFYEKYFKEGVSNGSKQDTIPEFEIILQQNMLCKQIQTCIRQPNYIKVFLVMYLSYINRVILNSIPDHLRFENTDAKVGYVVSIEKTLLNNLIGTKENAKELVFASGMMGDDNRSKKLKIITQGEELVSLIQQALKLELSLKSYFVLAQLHEEHIQLTLNQVVEISDQGEEASTIILQDEIIPIRNIYDSLFRYTWNNIITDGNSLIQVCNTHNEDSNYECQQLYSLENKTKFANTLKKFISNNILKSKSKLQLDERKIIHFSSNCDCKVHLSVRDLIDMAFKPVIRNVVTILSGTLVNTSLFRYYTDIQYLFVLIYFNSNLQFQKILVELLKNESDISLEEKEMDTCCLIIPDLPYDFLQPITHRRARLYKKFRTGKLQQISSEGYGFFIKQSIGEYSPKVFFHEVIPLYKEKRSDIIYTEVNSTVIPLLKKGDIINTSGLDKTFYLKKQSKVGPKYQEKIRIGLVKLRKSDNLESSGTIAIQDYSNDYLKQFSFVSELKGFKQNCDLPIQISIRPKGYSSCLQFSAKIVGQDITINEGESQYLDVGEPMTLAKF
ncbi:hypothetical protein BDF21DRAFT_430903 [Thamnidium elegans]|nr:hypothetical protein BDF21DRAFT_430903 [Thamnidium elegans]